MDADTSEKIRDVISFVHGRTLSIGVYSPGDISVKNMYEEAVSDLAEIIQQEVAKARLEENAWTRGQVIAEQALHAPNSGYGRQIKTMISLLNRRKAKILETLKEHKE